MDYTLDSQIRAKTKYPLRHLNATFNTIINNHNYNQTNPKNQPKPPKQPKNNPAKTTTHKTPTTTTKHQITIQTITIPKNPLKTHEPPVICFRNYASQNFRGKGNNNHCTF
jgi:hypothetical protein